MYVDLAVPKEDSYQKKTFSLEEEDHQQNSEVITVYLSCVSIASVVNFHYTSNWYCWLAYTGILALGIVVWCWWKLRQTL